MNYKVDESTLMAYLYDELGAEEREKVERHLQDDPATQSKLQELTKVRAILGKLEDEEPAMPLVMDPPGKYGVLRRLAPWLGAAAAACLLLLVGYATDFRATSRDGRLILGFGAWEAVDNTVNEDQLMPLIEAALDKQRELYNEQLAGLQTTLEGRIAESQKSVEPTVIQPAINIEDVAFENFLSQYQQRSMQQMAQLLEANSEIQREELQTFLAEYHQFLEERRLQDLQLIEAGFQAMQDNVDQQQSQTEEILANIITSVNSTNY